VRVEIGASLKKSVAAWFRFVKVKKDNYRLEESSIPKEKLMDFMKAADKYSKPK
jgi:hypothetical protein